MTSADIDLLELDTISDDVVTLVDFTDKYGDYLIVGWIYGGGTKCHPLHSHQK